VRSAHLEPGHDARRVIPALAQELQELRAWLELDQVEIGARGDLAAKLRRGSGAKRALP